MTRNEYMRFSLLFQPPVIFVNSKALSIKFVNARGRTLGHFITVYNTPSACGEVDTRKRGLGGNYVSPQIRLDINPF